MRPALAPLGGEESGGGGGAEGHVQGDRRLHTLDWPADGISLNSAPLLPVMRNIWAPSLGIDFI